jgi:antitoxin ParD1/3/4
MPIREVRLTEALDRFIEAQVATGMYEDASDVVRDALRALESQKQDYETKLEALKAAIAEGDASGVFEGDDPFDYARAAAGMPPARRE